MGKISVDYLDTVQNLITMITIATNINIAIIRGLSIFHWKTLNLY